MHHHSTIASYQELIKIGKPSSTLGWLWMYFLGKELSSVTNAITMGKNRVDTANKRLLHNGYAEYWSCSFQDNCWADSSWHYFCLFSWHCSSLSLSPFHTPTVPMAVGRAQNNFLRKYRRAVVRAANNALHFSTVNGTVHLYLCWQYWSSITESQPHPLLAEVPFTGPSLITAI